MRAGGREEGVPDQSYSVQTTIALLLKWCGGACFRIKKEAVCRHPIVLNKDFVKINKLISQTSANIKEISNGIFIRCP